MTIGKESLLETARETAPGRISQAVASEASVASTARLASAGRHSLPCGSPEGAGTALGGAPRNAKPSPLDPMPAKIRGGATRAEPKKRVIFAFVTMPASHLSI